MQLFLSLADSDKDAPNENYARELMELFTLGKGYTRDRHPRGRPRADRLPLRRGTTTGFQGIDYDAERHDDGVKKIFGKRGRFGVDDVLDIVCAHPRHAPFLVGKLWSFFVTTPPTPRDRARPRRDLQALGPQDQAGRARRSSTTPRSTRTSTRPTWSSRPVVYVAGHAAHGRLP